MTNTMSHFNGIRHRISKLLSDREAGMAILGAILFGAVLMLGTAVVVSRGNAQFNHTSQDACWESALAAAESAINWGAAQLDADPTYTTPGLGSLAGADRAQVIAAAESLPLLPLALPTGEAVFLKAADEDEVYGVGYCPNRDADNPRVRVVRATASSAGTGTVGGGSEASSPGGWVANHAWLVGGDTHIAGRQYYFQGANASLHANGANEPEDCWPPPGSDQVRNEYCAIKGGDNPGWPNFDTGCMTSSGGVQGHIHSLHNPWWQPTPPTQPGCALEGIDRYTLPPVEIPDINASDLWTLSEYDLCPDGVIRQGPAHPDGNTTFDEPCTGVILDVMNPSQPWNGWQSTGYSSELGQYWQFVSPEPSHGAYYAHHGTIDIHTNSSGAGTVGSPLKMLLMASAPGHCQNPQGGGNVRIAADIVFEPYRAGIVHESNNMFIIADTDVGIWSPSSIRGNAVVAVREQIQLSGSTMYFEAAFIAQDDCNTPGSSVPPGTLSNITGANMTFVLNGPIVTGLPGEHGSTDDGEGDPAEVMELTVTSWTELR